MASYLEFERAVTQLWETPGIPPGASAGKSPGLVELVHLREPMLFFRVTPGAHGVVHVSRCAPLPNSTTPPAQATQFETDHPDETPRQIWDLALEHFAAAWRPDR